MNNKYYFLNDTFFAQINILELYFYQEIDFFQPLT